MCLLLLPLLPTACVSSYKVFVRVFPIEKSSWKVSFIAPALILVHWDMFYEFVETESATQVARF